MSKSAQNGIALPVILLIVAGIIIVGLLSDKINIKTETPQPTNQPAESTAIPTSPTPEPNSQTTTTTNETPSPTSSPTSFKPKLPISTFIPIPTEKNLVPLASSYGASSTYGAGYEAQKAFDGSTSTRWSAAKNEYFGSVWIEWPTAKTITSISWTALPSKYGAPKDFNIYCVREGIASGIFSVTVKNHQGSSWSEVSVKDKDGNPAKVNECRITIEGVQNQTFAATLTEIQVEGY